MSIDDLKLDGSCPKCGSYDTELVPSIGGYDAKCKACGWTGSADDYYENARMKAIEEYAAEETSRVNNATNGKAGA